MTGWTTYELLTNLTSICKNKRLRSVVPLTCLCICADTSCYLGRAFKTDCSQWSTLLVLASIQNYWIRDFGVFVSDFLFQYMLLYLFSVSIRKKNLVPSNHLVITSIWNYCLIRVSRNISIANINLWSNSLIWFLIKVQNSNKVPACFECVSLNANFSQHASGSCWKDNLSRDSLSYTWVRDSHRSLEKV